MAQHRYAAGAGAGQAGNDIDQGGFTRAVRPQQTEKFAAIDAEVETLEGMHLAIMLMYPVNRNGSIHEHLFNYSERDAGNAANQRRTWKRMSSAD